MKLKQQKIFIYKLIFIIIIFFIVSKKKLFHISSFIMILFDNKLYCYRYTISTIYIE